MRNQLFESLDPAVKIETLESKDFEYPVWGNKIPSIPVMEIKAYSYCENAGEQWWMSNNTVTSCPITHVSEKDIVDLRIREIGKYHVEEGIYIVVNFSIRYDVLLGNMSRGFPSESNRLEKDLWNAQKECFDKFNNGQFPENKDNLHTNRIYNTKITYHISAEKLRKNPFLFSDSFGAVFANNQHEILRTFTGDSKVIREYYEGEDATAGMNLTYINNNPKEILYQRHGDHVVPVRPKKSNNLEAGIYVDTEIFNPNTDAIETYKLFIPLADKTALISHGLYDEPYAAMTENKYIDEFEYKKAVIKKDTEEKKLEAASLGIEEKRVVLQEKRETSHAQTESKNLASIATICTVAATAIAVVGKIILTMLEKKAVATALSFLPLLL